ncbi:MAG: hypothetical protein IJH86_09335 [Clostridia bacterium]|nr:hypothetical protein [Clostridia bacterium]
MKRIGLCLLLLMAGAFAAARAETATVLIYMTGASIQAQACEDIYEMALAETGANVNVAILAGGAKTWDIDELKGGSRTLMTLRDGDIENLEDWGVKSMGDGESLLEFLKYGLTTYPADRTVVILWNHGAGSEAGVCFDYTTPDQDGLSLTELNDALYDLSEDLGGFHIDVFGCDACMMATYEMAAMLSYYDIDYYIASEELETGLGWHYTPWLKALDEDPGMSGEALCRMIVDTYMDAGLKDTPDDYLTMSAVDLSGMEDLQNVFEDFAAALLRQLEQGNAADVRRGRSRMYTFGEFVDGSWDMVDMAAVLDAYAQFDPDLAARARKCLARTMLVNRQTDNLDPCCGLSVLIPQDTKDEFEDYVDGLDLSFYMPNWFGFVKAYAAEIKGGGYSISAPAASQASGEGVFSQIAALLSGEPDSLGWSEDAETYVPRPPQQDALSGIRRDDYAFTANLTAEDMKYLDYVEGMLAIDITDDDAEGYVVFGLMRDNLVDWNSGAVYSLFDGKLPVFGEQLVPLFDQVSNAHGRRSLMRVKLNGEDTYLVVEFPAEGGAGRVIGANAGYDENGLPIRTTTALKEGDRIVPVYTMYVDTGAEDMEETEFAGDEIIWSKDMTVTYEDLSDEDDALDVMFCFVLNDVFGEYTMTEPIAFKI